MIAIKHKIEIKIFLRENSLGRRETFCLIGRAR